MAVVLAAGGPVDASQGKVEVAGVPIVGGDSDIGWGGGFVGAVTSFASGDPHAWNWRVVASSLTTFEIEPSFDVPYQDHWIQLIVPHLTRDVRFESRIAFTKENAIRYYGVGNAVVAPPNDDTPPYLYERVHPILEAYARLLTDTPLYEIVGGTFTVDWLSVPEGGKLASDMRGASPEVRALLGDARTHAVALAQTSIGWDTRDDEVVPRKGTWHQVDFRLAPPLGSFLPYGYGELLGITRAYVPVGSRVVLAGRALADLLFGTPPFYQLAEYEDTYAIGGTAGVRGVPAQRYYGKIKLIANLEARADVTSFHALGRDWGLAVVGFFDAGRVWADWSSQPALDGTGLGLKWGTGAGLRVQQGKAFVVRGDVAWSPDAEPIAGYFAVGETF